MNKSVVITVAVALLLIGSGFLFLFDNMGLLDAWSPWVWTAAFAVAGLVFIGMFVVDRQQWWAIIPGGSLLVMAAIPVLDLYLPGDVTGALFFAGIGVVFLALYLLRSPARPLGWAIWPALGCLGFGLFVLVVSNLEQWAVFIAPAVLIALGLFVIWGAIRAGRRR
ncbi:MAG: hypothetical protein KKA73_02900 [Chloroflexi bacterium]|nr:hypothetical protein [Chloroflexota bacterium]MBU1746613.1 hypothetical protein [Chloroflexota bacterium]MBU1879233.1 hypothetical protein [Chloroflexota bacterium]